VAVAGGLMKQGGRGAGEWKAVYVRQLFGRIARHYDRMNHLMTLGCDRAWRRRTVRQLDFHLPLQPSSIENRPSKIVLDVATGTGDLALELVRQHPDVRVVGLDFSPPMLALARQKATAISPLQGRAALHLTAGDALRLPFADGTFDAVVTGFALRNVADIAAALAEMARVTRPGGQIACLEIARPRLPLFRQVFTLYFYRLIPLLGGWITGQRSAYTYLPHSLTHFPTPAEIAQVMDRVGWRQVRYRRLALGAIAVHVGVRDVGQLRAVVLQFRQLANSGKR